MTATATDYYWRFVILTDKLMDGLLAHDEWQRQYAELERDVARLGIQEALEQVRRQARNRQK